MVDDGIQYLDTRCIDCGVDTTPIEGPREWYMVHNWLWIDAGLNGDDGCLCIGCLEIRIGRTLNTSDFTNAPVNSLDQQYFRYAWSHRTARLYDRLTRES